jgi:transcriptional regulator with XRE-family HTH domain
MPTDYASRLRDSRARAEITQTELARRAQTRQTVISNYERGARVPAVGMRFRLATALDDPALRELDGAGEVG